MRRAKELVLEATEGTAQVRNMHDHCYIDRDSPETLRSACRLPTLDGGRFQPAVESDKVWYCNGDERTSITRRADWRHLDVRPRQRKPDLQLLYDCNHAPFQFQRVVPHHFNEKESLKCCVTCARR